MGLSVIQKGQGDALVILFFPSPIGSLKKKITEALGPRPTIVIDETAKGTETIKQIGEFAHQQTGIPMFSLACLGGYSAGCQRVRTLRMDGAEAAAFLLIDGAHMSNPPLAWQVGYMQDLVVRARQSQLTLVISHTYIETEPKYISTANTARLITGWPLPKPEPGGYNVKWEGGLTVYSVYSKPLDVKAHSEQAYLWLPIALDGNVRPIVEPGYEPGDEPAPKPPKPPPSTQGGPGQVCTAQDGWLDLEGDYLPRVVTQENGAAAQAAREAQAIAARTYLLRAMLDQPGLGTPAKPIPNSQRFQTYARTATAPCIEATQRTAGLVATYGGQLIFANYVAGAFWIEKGTPGNDPTNTERYVTHNEGKTGAAVQPTSQSSRAHPGNRGSMSQNGANWLAHHGYDYAAILRYFYGADLEIVDLRGATPIPPQRPIPGRPSGGAARPAQASGDDGAALAALAGLTWFLTRSG